MIPDRIQNFLENGLCHECHLPIDQHSLGDKGIHHCQCGERFILSPERALTILDEIPIDEYIGG